MRDGTPETVQASWEYLLNLYWKPVYFQIRRKGHGIEDAKDLTRQFFFLLMERESLKSVDPAKGKFRSFLLASLRLLVLVLRPLKSRKRHPPWMRGCC